MSYSRDLMPRALVTGATGFVGSHLVDLLLERGWSVAATLRRSSRSRWLDGKPVDRIEVDVARPFALPACDVLFHVAGTIRADSWPEYLEGNRDLALRVLEAARCGRFVHVSTLAVQGPRADCDESTAFAPISLYGKSKWEGEQAVWARRDRLPITVVRPPVVYGPRDTGLLDLYKTVALGLRPQIGGPKRISIVHVRDLVEGILRAAESPQAANEVFYLANAARPAVSDVLSLVERALGVSAARLHIPDGLLRFLGALVEDGARLLGRRSMFSRDKALEMTQPHWCCSPAKAERVLGWRAQVPLERGLAETLDWYRAEGLLARPALLT
jgi:dihydroflavonol-4-reductase